MTIIKIREIEGGWSVTVRGDQFVDVIDSLKGIIPAHYRTYSMESKTWTIKSRRCLKDWLNEVRSWGVSVEWATTGRQEYSQPRQTWPDLREAAYTTLHLLPSAPIELVAAAKKTLAQLHHPDRGGDLRAMQEINNAADVILKA
jgi:hypothetical protein